MAIGRDRVFISYRRLDSKAEAGRLRDSLQARLGADRVFQDVDMSPGTEFPSELRAQLDRAAIVLVLIDDSWLSATDQHFRRRIDDESDWVRLEVRTALESGAQVWPVTIDETRLPTKAALPDDISELSNRQSAVIRNGHWDDDITALVAKLIEATGWEAVATPGPKTDDTIIFGHPPIVANHFQDRSELLDRIDATRTAVLSAVSGIGGVGKSQLAAKYFSDHGRQYDYACWIDMRDREGQTGFEDISRGLGLSIDGVEPAEATRRHIMGSTARWLIVFDNAFAPEHVDALWPQSSNVKAIVTSRHRHWNRLGATIEVPLFDEMAAVSFLRARAGRGYDRDPDAAALVADLGNLPLAIGLAGTYCARMGYSFAQYRQRLAEDPRSVLSHRSRDDYDDAIASLWTDSLTAAEDDEPGARSVAQLLSVIDWTSVDRAWFAERIESADIDDVPFNRLDDILAALRSFSLIDFEGDRVAVTHNLLADGIARSAEPASLDTRISSLLVDSLPEIAPTLDVVRRAAEPLRHLQHLVLHHPDLIAEGLLPTLRVAASQLNHQGSMTSTLHLQVVDGHKRLLGDNHPDTLTAQNLLATSYAQAGRYNDAITTQQDVLATTQRSLGPDHPDTITVQSNLALSYADAGRYNHAITMQEEVLATAQRSLGPDHLDTLAVQANLAAFYFQAERPNDAITIQEAVLANYQRVLGPDHPNTLLALTNIAVSYHEVGRTNDAIALREPVLTSYERILGSDHPDTIRAKNNLAVSYWEVDRRDEAITLMAQALERLRATKGADHPDSDTSREWLIDWYRELGRDEDADALE